MTTDARGAPVTTTTRYVHGPRVDEPLLIETGGQVLAVHADGLGSVTGLTDASQTLVEARTYTAFGQPQRSGTWPGLAYAYTGREWEPELELYYYRARYYDPEAGRFLSRDPIGFEGGDANLYSYVFNNPSTWTDSTGLAVDECIKAYPNCGKCMEEASKCRDEHDDPVVCLERGENPGLSSGAHVLDECVFSNPNCNGCYEAILKCGYGPPTPLPRTEPLYPGRRWP